MENILYNMPYLVLGYVFAICVKKLFSYYRYRKTMAAKITVIGIILEIYIKVVLPKQFINKFIRESRYMFFGEYLCNEWGFMDMDNIHRYKVKYVKTTKELEEEIISIRQSLDFLKRVVDSYDNIINISLN